VPRTSNPRSTDIDKLLLEIEEFLEATWMPASTLGRLVNSNSSVVKRLRAGGDAHTSTVVLIRKFIKENKKMRVTKWRR
jgi:hypothetical protein